MRIFFLMVVVSVLAAMAGCTTLPHPYKGKLVDDWHEGITGAHGWYNYTNHMCKYDDGVVVNVGHERLCP